MSSLKPALPPQPNSQTHTSGSQQPPASSRHPAFKRVKHQARTPREKCDVRRPAHWYKESKTKTESTRR